jgi:hypothetical protein
LFVQEAWLEFGLEVAAGIIVLLLMHKFTKWLDNPLLLTVLFLAVLGFAYWANDKKVAIRDRAAQDARDRTAQDAGDKAAQAEVSGLTWTDPATGLMWTKKDNGNDVNWQQATDYCRNLQLAGHSGWRLATFDELHGIYDPNINVPGQCCGRESSPVTWHVKGNLQLSGWDWSSSQINASGWASFLYFSGNGKEYSFELAKNDGRALCVRHSGKVVEPASPQISRPTALPKPPVRDQVPAKKIRSEVHLVGGIYRFSGANVTSPGIKAEFVVHLYKQDEWFDTGIPIASQLFLMLYPTENTRWVQVMIGNTGVDPPADPKVSLYLRSSASEDAPRTPGLQHVIIPEISIFRPLRVRVSPLDDAPEEVNFYIRVIIRGKGGLSEVQQREEQAIMKQEGR